ncbi:UDP-N-acetylmuramoyl-L-alanine--D-glutamate ligase, partial [Candidatus Microgenomates bacterium]|nr:UDP-N-acetylmuramoyl-L-alanine--D-glutamate ligase [Candidatus Microgenomates bacterium]
GISIEMAESFFAKNCPGKIIGVTGTRGKSTTATLIARILQDAGKDVVLAGNVAGIGTLTYLDKINSRTIAVLELSSFQLNALGEVKISPGIAVITNIYPEHLNHYATFDNYVADKKNIFRYQTKKDYLVLNKNSKFSQDFAKEAPSKVIFFDPNNLSKNLPTKLLGEHNRENIAAALAVGQLLGVEMDLMRKTIANFSPLPYHLENVRTIKKIKFINDGVSTSPEATIAALNTLDGNIILILGGNDKKLDFRELGLLVSRKVKAIIMMRGTAAPKIKKAIPQKGLIKGEFDNLRETVRSAWALAKPGSIILFSPAATSFNWFSNTYQRSKLFTEIVKSL